MNGPSVNTSSTPPGPSGSTAPSAESSTTLVGQCDRCGKTAAELDESLKRCAGCSLSTYCSKECQRASWVVHRLTCRSRNVRIGHEKIARATLPGQGTALRDWVEIHKYALDHMARSALFLTGAGMTAALAADRAVIFLIALGTPGASSASGSGPQAGDNDPATAFRVISKPSLSPESLVHAGPRIIGELIKKQAARCRGLSVVERTPAPGKYFCPSFVGYVPAIFFVAASGVTLAHAYNIYCMRDEHDNPLSPRVRALHEDMMDVCFQAVNRGYVLQSPDRCTRPQAPLVCRFKEDRKEKIWKLRPVQWDWDRDASEMMSGAKTARRLNVQPPTAMWQAYDELW